ncbi:response regulator [Phaeovulum sp.]|jgi:two-component system chemotaxis response regulator CheY|uniref:response regulator n=1 Tax=Phaeovulum sp. TaxID=2934796 RepID=UPI002731F9DC|nr:response regulator [Phaeovulum sp.]MDP1667631.1 response regulator [Phaeovulum sp.]MDZ4118478.1 response regulator [Phaeovulum sp.]
MALRDQLRILVVDDMSTSRGLIMQALDSMGVLQVSYAIDGPGALAALEKSPVHLVISDFNMPGMDGLQLLQALRANPRSRGIGFILITGRADREIIEGGRKLGMNNYLHKPFTPTDLRSCIEAVVGRL